MPQLSVVLACYNAMPYLTESIKSICAQTFRDWELIVVNDGSTDSSNAYLQEIARQDDRVSIIYQANQGQQVAANVGIARARSPLVARMDADDISELDRFEKQIAFMSQNPQVGLLGGQIRRLGQNRVGLASNFPIAHDQIVEALLKNHHAICNPTIMFRKALFDEIGGYWKHNISEDWDMFLRMGEVAELANLDALLLSYRMHNSSINGRRIVEAQLYNEYAALSCLRRGHDQPNITFEEFLEQHRSRHWPASWLFYADSHSIGQYRRAIAEIYADQPLKGYCRLGVSMAMSPARTFRRLGNMLHRGQRLPS